MRPMRGVCASALVLGVFALAPAPASAQENAQALRQEIDQLRREFELLKQQYGDRLTALEQKLATMPEAGAPTAVPPPAPAPGAPAAAAPPPVAGAPPPAGEPGQPSAQVPPGAAGAGGPAGSLPLYGSQLATSKVFNPDIAVIGDFLGAAGGAPYRFQPTAPLEMHESEASFQAVVDPYARADFFLSFGQEGVDLEEGFATFTSLPGGLLTRVGKMRAAFGKVNQLHNHVLPWADRPLVTEELLNGEEGVSDAGVSVARLVPNPWLFLEATGQVFRGSVGGFLNNYNRKSLTYVGHLRAYQDITEGSNLDVGFSYLHGNAASLAAPDSDARLRTNLFGVDATYRWKPLRRAIYNSFVARTEWLWGDRELQPDAPAATGQGMYVSGDYQLARRWFLGGRYDRSRPPGVIDATDTSQSFIVTYWPSEFSQVRAQYRHANLFREATSRQRTDELLFQVQFSIGAHGAHPF